MNCSFEQCKSTNAANFPLQIPARGGEICGRERQEEKTIIVIIAHQ